mmetsp:Transcript_6134/g.18888  ORF Transcript_6134/g.18888 Transcript_6134/m.18888 type:complete len:156 (+) Transcript_6134:98-565(+)
MADSSVAPAQSSAKRKEIYTYTAPWLLYGMNWSVRADQRFRLAVGSFEEEYSNSVRIIQLNEETHEFNEVAQFEHPYPATKMMWIPDANGARRDLLATTGDYLRIWRRQGEVGRRALAPPPHPEAHPAVGTWSTTRACGWTASSTTTRTRSFARR